MVTSDRIDRTRRLLLRWGSRHKRDYLWRLTHDPYGILVAEFMLHRTNAAQVAPVYREFMARFPTLNDFVSDDPGSANEILQSLGLNWRIRGMIEALGEIHTRFGLVPTDVDSLKSITGIGPYIASAVHCFALNTPVPLVDTNTVRVTGRVFDLNLEGEARRRREMIDQIGRVCDPGQPRDFYFSMIDLAHAVCHPVKPLCGDCPLVNVPCLYAEARSP